MTPATLAAVPADGTLATLRPGERVEGVFACTRKERLAARTGAPYLALELRDRSGALPARLFRDADLQGGRFEAGELVSVSGRVVRFRERTQIELERIARADDAAIDPREFLPVAYRDLDELDGFLEHLAREVAEPGYRALLDGLLADESLARPVPPRRLHARRPPRLSRRAARAHRRGRDAGPGARARASPPGQRPADLRRRSSTTSARHASSPTARRSRPARRGGCSATSSSACACCASARAGGSTSAGCSRSSTACSATTAPDAAPGGRFASVEALALYRLNALDAAVKGALEHGLDARVGR